MKIHRSGLACGLTAAALLASTAGAQVVTSLGEDIFRLDASLEAGRKALPSLSFQSPARRDRARVTNQRPEFMPTVQTIDGRTVWEFELPEGTSLYGTGEVAGRLLRNGRTNVNWNSDSYGYDLETDSLYQTHPWVVGVLPDGSSFGVLADTTWRSTFDLRDGIRIDAEGPAYPLIIIERDHPEDVVEALADLTGTIEMPPKWAIGYHQCRYSYNPDSRVREIAREFRERDIPCDVIWMDIDYMDGFRVFTFDQEQFPDPAGLNAFLHEHGFRNVWMIDPGIKDEDGYSVHDSGEELDVWVKRADKTTTYTGEVWPGMCVFPDYTNAGVRQWWAGLYRDFMALGIDGVWNDMNEPAVFNVESKTMPEDNWHRADEAIGGPGPHAQYHNIYGMMMIKATREGVLAVNPDKRPFVLSRANFIGGHRYGAAWTGDNVASWEHMEWSVPMALNMGLSGQVFAGPDIGGFIGDGDGPMFARWMGFGSMLPFARGHTGKENRDKEPWAFGPEVEATSRRAISRRYLLMPYYYTLFWQAHREGTPIVKPIFFTDPADPALRSEDDAFLVGDDILVRAYMTPDRDRAVAMPAGEWRKFDFADRIEGDATDPDLPDLYIRAGAIVPTGPLMEYVDEKALDPLTLLVALDGNGQASGILYEDAGDGWGHRTGDNRITQFRARLTDDATVVVDIARFDADEGGRLRQTDGQAPYDKAAAGTVNIRLIHADGRVTTGSGRFGEPIEARVFEW
ncbi:MAG: TIM-barrel domain-containing protein [Phycisphaerales bacterium JB037]